MSFREQKAALDEQHLRQMLDKHGPQIDRKISDTNQIPTYYTRLVVTVSDCEFMMRADYWDEAEICALLVGLNPKPLKNNRQMFLVDLPQTALGEFRELEVLLKKSKDSKKISDQPSPEECLRWAISKYLNIPKILNVLAEEILGFTTSEATSVPDQSSIKEHLGTRERKSLLKILIGIAMEKYAFNPDNQKNSAAKRISDDLYKNGISVSEDTVRKYLDEAKDLKINELDE